MNHLFKTDDLIYESANSIIYRGFRLKDQFPVVLKKLNRGNPTPIELSRFRREFSIAARFDHPGIMRVFDILETGEGSLFITMEDCGGESLHRYFNHFKSLKLKKQLNIAYRIAECLEQIHAFKIIHMDINPANIVWCPNLDLVKIIDFGISSELSPEIEFVNPSALEGTLSYMSPEQTGRMNRPIDYRTDLYSLGITYYELFAGRLPFLDDDPLLLNSFEEVCKTGECRLTLVAGKSGVGKSVFVGEIVKHALVLFLDDLQWADNSILDLIDLLLLNKVKYLYVIGAYRSNEITDGHPLKKFISSVSQSNICSICIDLEPYLYPILVW